MPLLLALATGASGCDVLFPSSAPAGGQGVLFVDHKVQLNTVGFLPDRAKLATVVAPGGTTFNVVRTSDMSVAFSGPLTGPVVEADTSDQLWIADFSALTDPGEYTVVVPELGDSAPFTIGADLYSDTIHTAMMGLTGARCGTAVAFTKGSDSFSHRACHTRDAYLSVLTGSDTIKDSTGGWHDAGDYGKYTTNAAFAVGMLLETWERFAPALSALSLAVPEHGGAIPDFLAEVKWELNWLFTMQQDDGSVAFKATAFNFEGFVLPDQDGSKRYFAPIGTGATADFVAVMAMAARLYQSYDTTFADRCLTAAQAGYGFLKLNAVIVPDESKFSTGTYGDNDDNDERVWAAAELWETTGAADVLADFEARSATPAVDQGFDWPHVGNLGYFTYALSMRDGRSVDHVAAIDAALLATADAIVTQTGVHPYGRGIPSYYWGSAGVTVRTGMNLWVAEQLATDPTVKGKYADAMVQQLDYVLGRNPFGRSLVTGIGYHPPLHPHHRPSVADNVANPWPGMLVGGPQAAGVAAWVDSDSNFNVNEVAINWTSAFVYGIAAFIH